MLKKFRFIIFSIGTVFVLMLSSTAFAAPICPVPVEFTQPNGNVITVTTYGDEFFNWSEDENGNVIAYDGASGSYRYAEIKDGEIIPSSQIVGDISSFGKASLFSLFSNKIQREDIMSIWENTERADYSKPVENDSIQLMLADTEQQKPLTDQPLLTILIEFSDVKIQYGSDFWSRQMFDDTPGALSVVNYWKENANGKNIFIPADTKNVEVGREGTVRYEDYTDVGYTITGCSMGVVQVKLDMPHPVKTWDEREGTETGKTVLLVINALEQNFDFSIERPNIVTIFAGYEDLLGQGDGEGQVGGYTSIKGIETSEGINLGRYTVQGEKIQADVPLGIGIICHEIGHSVFNLPDLYFSTLPYGPSNGLVGYSLMSTGCWGYRYDAENIERNDYDDPYANCWSHVPAHLDPWCKIKCGFVTPTIVNDWDGNINSISDAENTYNVIKVQSKADVKQYFLIENRQCIGFDKGLEVLDKNYNKRVFNGGIIIYHIDENVSYNNNHNTNNHRFISIERCGLGTRYDNDPAIWAYINTEERNRLNNKTEPNSNFHIAAAKGEKCPLSEDCHPQNVESGISIEVLDESSPSMRVKVRVDDEYKIVETGETFSDVFPDINFCNAVIDKLKGEDSIERSPDDIISAGDWSKLLSIETLSVKDRNVEDLSGIENFSKLRTFNCSNNKLSKLDLSNSPLLMRVNCSNNQLTDINISNSKNLLYFHCENNLLKNLDLSGNIGLIELYCYGNQLEKLDLRNNLWIRTLHCYDNYMSENYELSIDKSENFDKAFPSGSSKFKYLPQKTTEEILTPTPTVKPTETPMPTSTVEPTASPSPTHTIPPTVEPQDRIEFTALNNNTVLAKLVFEDNKLPDIEDIQLFIAYRDKNDRLIRVEMLRLTGLYTLFKIPDEITYGNIDVYVWDENMKPLMKVQKYMEQ
ncbi:MAG: hypothetical protein Q4G33_14980 [bacterium]|nr:hypothetical protein [bacterium]